MRRKEASFSFLPLKGEMRRKEASQDLKKREIKDDAQSYSALPVRNR